MTTPIKGTVPYIGKAGSLYLYPLTSRIETLVDRLKIPKMTVWDNLKSRLLIADLSNNRSSDRETSLNRVAFDFIRRT